MEKSPDAFRTISEVAEWLDVPTHVLRFWESRFSQVKPVKRAGGRRYYRPTDMQLIGGIKHLLHDQGMTIRAVQKLLREEGVKHVSGFSQPLEHEREEALEGAVSEDLLPAEAEGESEVIALIRESAAVEAEDTPVEEETAPEEAVVQFGSVRGREPELPFVDENASPESETGSVAAEPSEEEWPGETETAQAAVTDPEPEAEAEAEAGPATPAIPPTPDVPPVDPEDDAPEHATSPGIAARLLTLDRRRLRDDAIRIEQVVDALRAARDRSAS